MRFSVKISRPAEQALGQLGGRGHAVYARDL